VHILSFRYLLTPFARSRLPFFGIRFVKNPESPSSLKKGPLAINCTFSKAASKHSNKYDNRQHNHCCPKEQRDDAIDCRPKPQENTHDGYEADQDHQRIANNSP
jgi:hypothetical protein